MDNVLVVSNIVKEQTGREPVHLSNTDHEEHKRSRNSCCWTSPLVVDGFEIQVCQPSPAHKGDTLRAFFTFLKK